MFKFQKIKNLFSPAWLVPSSNDHRVEAFPDQTDSDECKCPNRIVGANFARNPNAHNGMSHQQRSNCEGTQNVG